jgi:hypothetical protein
MAETDQNINPTSWDWFSAAHRRDTGIATEHPSEDAREKNGNGLSAYWRKNTSHLEAVELANILRALNKVVGYVGSNTGKVEWAGMSSNNGAIVLDPALVMDDPYPVSYKKFDYLVGIAVHEALRRTQWVDLVWSKVAERSQHLDFSDQILLHKVVHFGETIYVDIISEPTMLGKYTQIARKTALGPVPSDHFSPSVDDLFQRWWIQSFDCKEQRGASLLEKPMGILSGLTAQLREIAGSQSRVANRCTQRVTLYMDALAGLMGMVRGWKGRDNRLIWLPEGNLSTKTTKRKKTSSMKRLSAEITQSVEERLSAYSNDLTPIVRSVAGTDNPDVVPTSRWDFNISAHPVLDTKMVSRLKSIIQSYANRKTVFNRGLEAGRVDRRRLYRAPISGRCFYDKQRLPVVDWTVCILVDATASMAGYGKWRMVENTLGAVHKAFSGFQNRIQGYGYFEVEGVCMISRLIDGNRVLSVPPSGQTASGQAIILAAHFMPANANKKIIIHITDGESNFGCHVRYGIDYCQRSRIHLVTLGIGYKDRAAMKRQYGKSIQFVDGFGQLPNAVENLFKWTFMYGKVPLSFSLAKSSDQAQIEERFIQNH